MNIPLRSGWSGWERTLADDLRDDPRPVDDTPHEHFHTHAGVMHSHTHVHPEGHAHSARTDTGAHERWQ